MTEPQKLPRDSFAYTIKDQFGFTDTATVQITVEGRNDAPVIAPTPVAIEVAEASDIDGATGKGVFDHPELLIGNTGFLRSGL